MKSTMQISVLLLALMACDSTSPIDHNATVEWIQIINSDWVAMVASEGELVRMESGTVLRSSDHGDTWTSSKPPVPEGWLEIGKLEAVSASGLIVAVLSAKTKDEAREDYRGLARSTDGGASFEEIPTEWLGPQNIFVDPVDVWIDKANTLFASAFYMHGKGGPSIYRMDSGGVSWTGSLPSEDASALVRLNFDPQAILHLLAINNSTFRSRDGGRNWELLSEGDMALSRRIILPDTRRIYRTGINPASGPGSDTLGLFSSEDEGTSWSHLDFFTPSQSVTEVVVGTNGHLFAVVEESQIRLIYRSTDEGVSWEEVNLGLPPPIAGIEPTQLGGLMMGTDGYLYVHYVNINHSVYRTTESVGGI